MLSSSGNNGCGTRDVLIVDRSSRLPGLEADLTAVGWKVSHAGTVDDVKRHLERHDHCVGVLCVDDLGFVEDVLASNSVVHWIAVVNDEILADTDTQLLLSHHFYDYHRLPVDIRRLTLTLGHALGIARLRQLHASGADHDLDDHIVGECEGIQIVKEDVARVAQKDFPVLICGESGTGKELIARAIHDHSPRNEGPFIAVNCGALPGSLIQTELFGHEKGAFTGAVKRRIGRFEAASGGTLFLDEMSELSLDLQVNLLRVLEQGVIERVGDHVARPVDTRVVAATNIDLHKAVKENRFREDLYYRLNVFQIDLPPLRERGNDLLLLADLLLSRYSDEDQPKAFSKRARTAIRAYTWPGNVRELINRIQRAHISSRQSRLILPEHLGLGPSEEIEITGVTLEEARNRAERRILSGALQRHTHNITRVALELAVSRVTLYRLLKKHELDSAIEHG